MCELELGPVFALGLELATVVISGELAGLAVRGLDNLPPPSFEERAQAGGGRKDH